MLSKHPNGNAVVETGQGTYKLGLLDKRIEHLPLASVTNIITPVKGDMKVSFRFISLQNQIFLDRAVNGKASAFLRIAQGIRLC